MLKIFVYLNLWVKVEDGFVLSETPIEKPPGKNINLWIHNSVNQIS